MNFIEYSSSHNVIHFLKLSEFHFPTIPITNIDRVPLLIVEIVEMYITTINIGSNFTCPSNLLIGPRDVKENLKKVA
jgi:hypothetical protein